MTPVRTIELRVVCVEDGEDSQVFGPDILCHGEKCDPIKDYQEVFSLSYPLLTHQVDQNIW